MVAAGAGGPGLGGHGQPCPSWHPRAGPDVLGMRPGDPARRPPEDRGSLAGAATAGLPAFLLCVNGGHPSRPYLYSYADYPEGSEEYYDEVRFFSTADRDPDGRLYLLLSVVEVYHGRV